MDSLPYLTAAELRGITGKAHRRAQAEALASMHIPFVCRPDGSALVSRAAFEQALGVTARPSREREIEPDFGAI